MASFDAPIGISDFRELRQAGATYVDKTALISELLASSTKVALFPRPRRFGKTLNLSTLRYFFETSTENHAPLFEGLAVWDDPDARRHFGRYPVIDLTLKGLKGRTWDETFIGLRDVLADLVVRFAYLLDGNRLSRSDRLTLERLLRLEAQPAECTQLLAILSEALAAHHDAPAVILIDEYDTPLYDAHVNGYYPEAAVFFGALLTHGLKDNPHLFKGVVTGILRVAKESIFSDLNNLAVYTTLDARYPTAFGFTDAEVVDLCRLAGAEDHLPTVREWYDGYRFGGHVIYNPWSVLNFLAEPTRQARPWWRLTASDEILRGLLIDHRPALAEWEALIRGEAIEQSIFESIVLRDLDRGVGAVWTFLVFSGYLTATDVRFGGIDVQAKLHIPNREVRTIYQSIFARWLDNSLGSASRSDALLRAILAGDAQAVADGLTVVLTEQASYHDFPRRGAEATYQAFILGMLVRLAGEYRVQSNRESGYGRADVLVIPARPGRPGVVLELKVPREGETAEHALETALAQIADRDYAAELRAAGADPIHTLAVVFDGKRAHARAG